MEENFEEFEGLEGFEGLEEFEVFATILFLIWFHIDQTKKRRAVIKSLYKVFIDSLFNLDFRQRELAV